MDYYSPYENRFSTGAILCGVLSILTVFTGILPAVFGGLGILFYLLGRRQGVTRTLSDSLGLIASIVGLFVGIAMVVITVTGVIIPYFTDPESFSRVADYYAQYGIDLNAVMNDAYLPR